MSVISRVIQLEKKRADIGECRMVLQASGSTTGWGTTNKVIPVFTTTVKNTITAGIILNSTAAGFSFTAQKRCLVVGQWGRWGLTTYGIVRNGWTVNSAELTTTIDSVANSSSLGYSQHDNIAGYILSGQSNCEIILEPGDVLRPHSQNVAGSNGTAFLCLSVLEL